MKKFGSPGITVGQGRCGMWGFGGGGCGGAHGWSVGSKAPTVAGLGRRAECLQPLQLTGYKSIRHLRRNHLI